MAAYVAFICINISCFVCSSHYAHTHTHIYTHTYVHVYILSVQYLQDNICIYTHSCACSKSMGWSGCSFMIGCGRKVFKLGHEYVKQIYFRKITHVGLLWRTQRGRYQLRYRLQGTHLLTELHRPCSCSTDSYMYTYMCVCMCVCVCVCVCVYVRGEEWGYTKQSV